MNYSKWHWLHPCGWLFWVFLISNVIFAPFAWSYNNTEIAWLPVAVYLLCATTFLLPLALLPAKELKLSRLKLHHRYTYIFVAIYLVLTFLRIYINQIDYEILRVSVGGSLFFMNFFSWLIIFSLLTLPFVAKFRGLQILMILAETTFLFMSGFREWLVVFYAGIFIVLAAGGVRMNWALLPVFVLLFIFLISPLWSAQRSAGSYLDGLTEQQQEEVSGGIIYHTGRYFFNHYGSFVRSGVARLGASGDAGLRIVRDVPEKTPYYNFNQWGMELNRIFVPRLLWPEKPDYRPGEVVYATFYDVENERRISHPSGFIGELWWLAGWWSLLILPMFSAALVLISNFLLRGVTSWLFLHFFLFFLFTEAHLFFYASAWLRVLPVYLLFSYLMHKYKF